ncbi:MAG: hypothetical protein H6732_17485 [Alphaproteobacteria bacterium]|nr:hypothetical protein [Alphaproteobacteria bacterium]
MSSMLRGSSVSRWAACGLLAACTGGGAPVKPGGGADETDAPGDSGVDDSVPDDTDTDADTADTDAPDTDTADTDAADTDTDGGEPALPGCAPEHFDFAATPIAWSLPEARGTTAFTSMSGGSPASCDLVPPADSYSTVDGDGDGTIDLLVQPCGATNVRVAELYRGTATGFEATSIPWYNPDTYAYTRSASTGWVTVGSPGGADVDVSCPAVVGGAATVGRAVDLDGDGLQEVVLFTRCYGATGKGLGRFGVHLGTAAGWAQDPVTWSLPVPPLLEAYDGALPPPGSARTCEPALSGAWRYHLRDLDGDGATSVVVDRTCDLVAGDEVGFTHLQVHDWQAGGGVVSTRWALPDASHLDPTVAGAVPGLRRCADGTDDENTRIVDTDGDGWLDLLVTHTCDPSDDVGTARWKVHRGIPGGFAAQAVDWTGLPSSSGARPDWLSFRRRTGGEDACLVAGIAVVDLTDLNGDGVMDLLVRQRCSDTDTSVVAYDVWFGRPDASGFLATSVRLTLPQDYAATCPRPPPSTGITRSWHTRVDVDGDGLVDFVIADRCDEDVVGGDHWQVYKGTCSAP